LKRAFIFVVCATVVTSLANAALTWDGGYQLTNVLEHQNLFIVENRWSVAPIHWLIIFLSRLTDNLSILRIAYSFCYCVIPLLALCLSWWIVRKSRPDLLIWAGLGILAASLPGQMFFISEATITMQLFWPILLLLITGIPRPKFQFPLIGFISVLIFFGHPNGVILFIIAAFIAFFTGFKIRAARIRLWTLVPLFLLGSFLRFQLIPTELGNEYALRTILQFIKVTLFGFPILYLALIYGVGCVLFLIPSMEKGCFLAGYHLPKKFSPLIASKIYKLLSHQYLIPALLIVGSILMVIWAIFPSNWINGLGMRRLVLFTNLPFIFLVWLEGTFERTGGPLLNQQVCRTRVMQAVSAIYFLVLSIQSAGWIHISNQMMVELDASHESCISTNSILWLSETPLTHWGTPAYAILLQGRTPTHLLLSENDCIAVRNDKKIQVTPWESYPTDASGWFDFSKVAQ
jgi:hypothetical protein